MRFVLSPDKKLVLDYNNKLPGRGCYLCPDRRCIEEGLKKGAISRAFNGEVETRSIEALIAAVSERIAQQFNAFFSLALRGRYIVQGSDAVERRLKKDGICLILLDSTMSESSMISWQGRAQNRSLHLRTIPDEIGFSERAQNRKVFGITDEGLGSQLIRELDRFGKINAC